MQETCAGRQHYPGFDTSLSPYPSFITYPLSSMTHLYSEGGSGHVLRIIGENLWDCKILFNGYRVFSERKGDRGVVLTPRPLLAPRLRMGRSCTGRLPSAPVQACFGWPLPLHVIRVKRLRSQFSGPWKLQPSNRSWRCWLWPVQSWLAYVNIRFLNL